MPESILKRLLTAYKWWLSTHLLTALNNIHSYQISVYILQKLLKQWNNKTQFEIQKYPEGLVTEYLFIDIFKVLFQRFLTFKVI